MAELAEILSAVEALKVEDKGSRFDSMMAREGIKDLGAKFVAKGNLTWGEIQIHFSSLAPL